MLSVGDMKAYCNGEVRWIRIDGATYIHIFVGTRDYVSHNRGTNKCTLDVVLA